MNKELEAAVENIRVGAASLGASAANLPDEIQGRFVEAHLTGFGEALANGMGRALAAEYLYRAADHVVAMNAAAPSIQWGPEERGRLSSLLRKLRGL